MSWRVLFYVGLLAMASVARGYETETHALITRQAYENSNLAATGTGSLVNRLGLDRLDRDDPFHAYWLSGADVPAQYFDEPAAAVGTYFSLGNTAAGEFEKCQMQEFLPPYFLATDFRALLFTGTVDALGAGPALFPIQNWLVRGAIREDDLGSAVDLYTYRNQHCGALDILPTSGNEVRVLNHFYDPVNNVGLAPCPPVVGPCQKSVDWALGVIDSFPSPPQQPQVDPNRRNSFSYADARNNYWWALTKQSRRPFPPYNAANRALDAQERLSRWATAFRALGDVVHLLEDTAQPQHARNDPHSGFNSPEQQAFEAFTNARVLGQTIGSIQGDAADYLRSFFGQNLTAKIPAPPLGTYGSAMFATPARFFSTRNYGDTALTSPDSRYGLADYTNRGFFTGGTLPGTTSNHFAEPVQSIDSAHGYTAVPVPCVLPTLNPSDPTQAVSCTHYTHAVLDTVNPAYAGQDVLPGGFSAPPLVSDSVFRESIESYALSGALVSTRAIGVEELVTMGNLTIPRAVGYATGMLNYFFRGQLTVSAPPDGLFGVLDQGTPHTVDADGYPRNGDYTIFGFTTVRARVKNTTADIHESGSGAVVPQNAKTGQLVAIARYHRNPCYSPDLSGEYVKKPDGSFVVPSGCSLAQTRTGYQEISVSAPIAIDANGNFPGTSNGTNACANVGNLTTGSSGTCANAAGVLGEFDFSADPIPANATDLFLQVAYRGGLGQEADGIAVGTIDLLEPNYYTVWNNSDWYAYNGQWTLPANVPATYDPNPIPITDSVYCWQNQLIFSFATQDVIGPAQFYRIGVLADLAPHQVGDVTDFDNEVIGGLGGAFVGPIRQSDKENGGTVTAQPMVYARGTTVGTIGWYTYYKFWPDDSATTTALLNLQPTIGNPGAPGRPVAGIAHYTSSPSSMCTGSLLQASSTNAVGVGERSGTRSAQ